jgi:hypothetical protein
MLTAETHELSTLRRKRQRLALDAVTDPMAQGQLEVVERDIDRLTREQERAALAETERAARAKETGTHRQAEILGELKRMLTAMEKDRDAAIRAIRTAHAPDPTDVERAYVQSRSAYSLSHDLLALTGSRQFQRDWNVRGLLGEAAAMLPVTAPGQRKPAIPRPWATLLEEYRRIQV